MKTAAPETTFLGQTGVRVSRLGFGTMSFGGDADEATARAMFARCREAGINLFDCADVYNHGAAEEILGRLIADCRHEIVLTSKAYFPMSKDPNARGSSRYHLLGAVEASLRRLGTETIDLFFLHRFDDATPLEETLRAVEHLVQQGKILYPAVSNFAAWQTARALGLAEKHGWAPIVAVQPMYNLVKRQAEVEILPLAAAEGLAVLPYSPLGGGLLTGKYGIDRRPDTGRLRENEMYKTRYAAPVCYEIADAFTQVAREVGHHPASLAIAWVAHHPAVTAPLVGARSVDQLATGLAATEIDMTDELYARVAALSPPPAPATDRNEEATGENYGTR
jgi:aryl-alcohol dehydrogenase-like predicted oxidoreductase